MSTVTIVLALVCFQIYGLALATNREEVNIETNEDDPSITKMYAKEIDDGDNAELPLEKGHHKHHKGNKKHFFGPIHGRYHGGYHGGYHGAFHTLPHHVPIGLPVNDGIGLPHCAGYPHLCPHRGHHIRIADRPSVIYVPGSHHGMHHPCMPGCMPLPYPFPLCTIEKDDDKKKDDKKDDKKKEKGKKSKRQLVPCHYYGPPGAGWGAFHPGWKGEGWGAPFWY